MPPAGFCGVCEGNPLGDDICAIYPAINAITVLTDQMERVFSCNTIMNVIA